MLCQWLLVLLAAIVSISTSVASAAPGAIGRYAVLTTGAGEPPPVAAVDFTYGPRETVNGRSCYWSQVAVYLDEDRGGGPMYQVRVLSRNDPLANATGSLECERYQLRIGTDGETLEYRNAITGRALLPGWVDFERQFLPRRAPGSGAQNGVANTATFLGHVLTLRDLSTDGPWATWDDVRVLSLDPELLIGTSRSFKDKEGKRLPQQPERQNYTYIPFVEDDYKVMIETGVNLFVVDPNQEQWVRAQPVFYVRSPGGQPPVRFPVDLYRSNWIGMHMFMDEPTSIMTGDKYVNTKLKYWSDAAALIRMRVHAQYNSVYRGLYSPEKYFIDTRVNLGDLRVAHEFPSWETMIETTFYQMEGGCDGLIQEGRYQLGEFNEHIGRWLGDSKPWTAEEMLRFNYALLRGGTSPFGKSWGMAIYGQADPAISPLAMSLAYDMGARYVWFWSSDHDHHVPWPEQMDLTRKLRKHVAEHPRPSIEGRQPERDVAIVLPYGYFLWIGNESNNPHTNLWWVRELDVKTHSNESSKRFSRLMKGALRAVRDALDKHEDFDITIDDGREIRGYKRVIRISDQ